MKILMFLVVFFATFPTSDTCTLPAPASGSGTHNGTSLSISWAPVTSAVSYHIRVVDLSTQTVIHETDVSGTSETVYSTSPTTNYRATVAPNCSGGTSTNIIVIDLLGA